MEPNNGSPTGEVPYVRIWFDPAFGIHFETNLNQAQANLLVDQWKQAHVAGQIVPHAHNKPKVEIFSGPLPPLEPRRDQ